MKIKIEPHSKTSASKNGIAELDGRLAQINRIMRDIMVDKNITKPTKQIVIKGIITDRKTIKEYERKP